MSTAKTYLLDDVAANETEKIHEAYLAGEEPEDVKKQRKAKRCRCILIVLLVWSLSSNAMLMGPAFLYIINFLSPSFPAGGGPAPKPVPVLNGSCPFSNGTMDGKAVLALYKQSATDFSVCWPKSTHKVYWNNPYTILQDDWFDTAPLRTVLSTEGNSYSMTGLVPGQQVQLQLQTWTASDPAKPMKMITSPVLTINMPELGGCGNHADLLIIRNDLTNGLAKKVQTCDLNPKYMFDHDKLVKCITTTTGVTPGCANCYAENNGCIINNCLKQCMNGNTPACITCNDDKCYPAMGKCMGLPIWIYETSKVIVK